MANKMKVALMTSKKNIEIVERDIPKIKDDEVLIDVKIVGICGSDLHYYEEGKIGDVEVDMPFILGHEVSGVVLEVGSKVNNIKSGDRISVEAGIPCGECELCLEGKYNICSKVRFLATPPIDGAFSEYIAYPSNWVHKIADEITFEQAALIEPLAVGLNATEVASVKLGQRSFIFGCGCIGLSTLMALKSSGVSEIYMCDLIPSRIQKALELGATEVFDVSKDNFIDRINDITNGHGVDHVFEMTGSELAIKQTIDIVKKGGTIVLVGLGSKSEISFNFAELIWKEVNIKSGFRYKNVYPYAIRALKSGMLPIENIISHRYKLDEIAQSFKYHLTNKNNIIKMIIEMN